MFNIPETYAQMGKLSNNLEKHGEEDVTAFDVPISGITLTGEGVNALLEDPYADRWLFDTKATVREPNLRRFKPLVLDEIFEDATVLLTILGETHTFTGCRIKDATFDAKRGGDVMLSFGVRLRPENDDQILQLIAQQNHEIKIDVQDAKIAAKGGRKQQELPLNQASDDNDGDGEHPDPDAENLTHPSQLFEEPKKRGRKRKTTEPLAH